jgi:hypothetical protein
VDQEGQSRWLQLAESIGQLGYDILDEGPKLTVTPKGFLEPRVLAIALMSRALSNFKGVIILLTNSLIVEARILVRCCFEDAFWLLGLRAEGDEFARKMLYADARSKKTRGELIFNNINVEISEETEKRLRAQMRRLNKQFPKARPLDPSKVALEGIFRDGYLIYSQLSADAAHPTLESLHRHIGRVEGSDERIIEVVPPDRPAEVVQTWGWACHAMLATCVVVNEIFGGTPAGHKLLGIAEQVATTLNNV